MQGFGIAHIWAQGDFVIRGIALTLMAMTALSWSVMIAKYWGMLRLRRMTRSAEWAFWNAGNFDEGIKRLSDETPPDADNPFLALALSGQQGTEHRRTRLHLHDRLDASDWITRCLQHTIDESIAHMQSGLAILASIGSTAPFVGLFGTVWGIYHALLAISAMGQVSIDQVAGPVGESLIMTAFGLLVAIPAVLGYNALIRENRGIVARLNRFAHSLHAYLVTGASLPLRTPGMGFSRDSGAGHSTARPTRFENEESDGLSSGDAIRVPLAGTPVRLTRARGTTRPRL